MSAQQYPMAYRGNNGAALPPINTIFNGPLSSDLRMPAIQTPHAQDNLSPFGYMSSVPPSPLPSPVMSDSDSSGPLYSPASSRRASVITIVPRPQTLRSRKSSRAATAKRQAVPMPADQTSTKCGTCGKTWCSHIEKALKERFNRKAQGERLQDAEDFLQILGGFTSPRLQSPGNHNAAGLDITKNEVLDWVVAYASWKMQDEYEEALRDDRVPEWRATIHKEVNRRCESGHPLTGTWLLDDPKSKPCDHERHSKTCTVHGHEDWSKCRKERRQEYFTLRKDLFLAKCKQSVKNAVRPIARL